MSEPKRTICQVLHSLTVGGAEVLAARIALGLGDRYRFVFACLDQLGPLGEQLRRQGLAVEVLDRRPGIDFRCMRRLARFWRRTQVELVHAHQYTPFFYAMAARHLRHGPPILFTEHGRWFPDYPRRKRLLFNRLALRRGDRVVGVGEAVRQALVRNEGFPALRVKVIYNGVDPSALNGQPADRAAVRGEIGARPNDLVIAQVARLDHLKDHGTAIRTIERVARQRPECRLILVGEGPEREKIEEEIRRRGVAPYVRFLGLRHDVPRILHAADLFLLTSKSEGIPVTVLEAMAASLPVVATDVGGVSEIVDHGRTGLLAPPGSDEALAQAVLRLAADAGLRGQMGALGRVRAREAFSEQRMLAGYQECFEEMLHGSA